MATNQVLREGIYEGILCIFLKAAAEINAGDVMSLTGQTGANFIPCASTGVPFGICAEKVTTAGVEDYEPGGLVSQTAKVGDYVGVYIGGGVYNQYAPTTGVVFGSPVYAGTTTAGKLSASTSTNATIVGISISTIDTTSSIVKFKSNL